jgi:nitronate monooxygenase
VAAQGGVGTIASVDLRRHHPDLMERTGTCRAEAKRGSTRPTSSRWTARSRAARALAGGRGLMAVNVMRAVTAYADYVRQALRERRRRDRRGRRPAARPARAGADIRRSRSCRSCPTRAACSWWCASGMRKGRLPDAIVIEHPRLAGGHLGAARSRTSTTRASTSRTCCRRRGAFFASSGSKARSR